MSHFRGGGGLDLRLKKMRILRIFGNIGAANHVPVQ